MYNSSDVRYESYEKSAKKEVYVTATFADLQFNARASMSGAMKTLQAVKAFKNQMNSGECRSPWIAYMVALIST